MPSRMLLRNAAATDLMITRRYLIADGFNDGMLFDRVRDGHWRALGKGVYRLAPDPLTWRHYSVAATLAYGPGAAVGGHAAAYALRLVDDPPHAVTVLLRTSHTPRPSGLWLPRSDRLDRCSRAEPVEDKARLGGVVRVTSLEDTALDQLGQLDGDDEVVALLSRVLSSRGNAALALSYWSSQRRRIPHRALLQDVLDEANGVRSALEYRYRRDCERPHRLPVGELQAAIRSGAIHDVAYRAYRTLLELDGARYHGGDARFRDMTRDNKSLEQGFVTLRYGWHHVVSRPCEVAAQVAAVLSQRGWTGTPRRCPRCPEA